MINQDDFEQKCITKYFSEPAALAKLLFYVSLLCLYMKVESCEEGTYLEVFSQIMANLNSITWWYSHLKVQLEEWDKFTKLAC